MKAVLGSKGQVTIPAAIRERLRLEPGQVLDLDESAPYLKAIPVFDEEDMLSVFGCRRGALERTSQRWLNQTRGPVKLPPDDLGRK